MEFAVCNLLDDGFVCTCGFNKCSTAPTKPFPRGNGLAIYLPQPQWTWHSGSRQDPIRVWVSLSQPTPKGGGRWSTQIKPWVGLCLKHQPDHQARHVVRAVLAPLWPCISQYDCQLSSWLPIQYATCHLKKSGTVSNHHTHMPVWSK